MIVYINVERKVIVTPVDGSFETGLLLAYLDAAILVVSKKKKI